MLVRLRCCAVLLTLCSTRTRAPVNGGEERVDEVVGEPCVRVREAHVRLRAQLRHDLVLVVQPQDLPACSSTALWVVLR